MEIAPHMQKKRKKKMIIYWKKKKKKDYKRIILAPTYFFKYVLFLKYHATLTIKVQRSLRNACVYRTTFYQILKTEVVDMGGGGRGGV